jgi:HlyD family secretion protein
MRLSPGRRRALVTGLVFAVIAGIAYVSAWPVALPPVTGVVRSTEILIAPELSGRLGRLHAKAGDQVRAGDVLAELDNPELVAAVAEAKAAFDVAKATRDRVYAGIRQEQVDILAHEVDKRRANLVRTEQEYQRIAALAANNNAPRQRLDEVSAAAAVAQAELEVAIARHAEAQAGPTAEERAVADAGVALAQASLVVLERRLDKAALRAPVDGMVKVLVAEPGEAIRPAQPVVTVEAAGERYLTFSLREDRLHGIGIGTPVDAILAGAGRRLPARVSEARRLGDFATWRAARAVGDHDLNTFFVRADLENQLAELEPGMTVLWPDPTDGRNSPAYR